MTAVCVIYPPGVLLPEHAAGRRWCASSHLSTYFCPSARRETCKLKTEDEDFMRKRTRRHRMQIRRGQTSPGFSPIRCQCFSSTCSNRNKRDPQNTLFINVRLKPTFSGTPSRFKLKTTLTSSTRSRTIYVHEM